MGFVALPVLVLFALLSGCTAHIKAYEGPTLGRESTARVRALAVDDKPVGVGLVNPVTNDLIRSGKVVDRYDRTLWLVIRGGEQCLVARSWAVTCPSILEAFSPHNPGCRRGGIWHEREICFDAQAGKTYEIKVTSENGARSCQEEVIYRLVDVGTGSTIGAFQSDSCKLANDF